MFHNAIQDEAPTEPVDNDGRVYHVWFGIKLVSIFSHPNVRIAMHHCGRGILDDTIEAGIVPICVGTSDFSDDQFEFAQAVEREKIGRGIPDKASGIYFVDAREPSSVYKGEQKSFEGQESLVTMFKDVWSKYRAMKGKVKAFQKGVMADTSGVLAYETLFQLKYFQYERNEKSLSSGKTTTDKGAAGKKTKDGNTIDDDTADDDASDVDAITPVPAAGKKTTKTSKTTKTTKNTKNT